jgi:hypothetical protein
MLAIREKKPTNYHNLAVCVYVSLGMLGMGEYLCMCYSGAVYSVCCNAAVQRGLNDI